MQKFCKQEKMEEGVGVQRSLRSPVKSLLSEQNGANCASCTLGMAVSVSEALSNSALNV